jgi:hypothetical protein
LKFEAAKVTLIHNERIRYLATLLNTVATAIIVVGVVTPVIAHTFGVPGPVGIKFEILESILLLFIGGILHYFVRVLLGRLRP